MIQPLVGHRPGYPRQIDIQDWEALLRPSSRRVFRLRTLALAGLLGTALLLPAPAQAGPLKSDNKRALEIAERVLASTPEGGWSKRSKLGDHTVIEGNPPARVPVIPISFGNSYSGVVDVEQMRATTVELFAAYGVELARDVPIQRKGIAFVADGWDAKRHIGFEILQREGDLTPEELVQVSADIREDELTLLAMKHQSYPIMDGDAHPATVAYLQTVLDYLAWLKTEGRI